MLTRRRIPDTATYDELVISPLAHAVSLATTARGPMLYSHIISYQGFLVRPFLRELRPQVHYKSQPDATAQRETQKSTNVKSLTKIE